MISSRTFLLDGKPWVYGNSNAVAIGRFLPDGPIGYQSEFGGPLRATREEALADYIAQRQGALFEEETC